MSRSFTSKLFSAIAALVMLVGAISLLLTGTITHSFAQGTGTITEYPLPTSCSLPLAITEGPDGNVWFTEAGCNSSGGRSQIGKITPSGTITEYPTPTSGSSPGDITTGPDGNLWFTERGGNKIGKITPSGTITEYPIPTSNSEPLGITTGPDGNLWFTEENANNIGQANLSTPSPSPSPSPSPTPVNTQIVWPFQPSGDQWTIVNGYRGFVDHALGGSPNNYAHLAFDFAKCLPNKVNLATGTCDLTNGWLRFILQLVAPLLGGTTSVSDYP